MVDKDHWRRGERQGRGTSIRQYQGGSTSSQPAATHILSPTMMVDHVSMILEKLVWPVRAALERRSSLAGRKQRPATELHTPFGGGPFA